VKTLVYVADGKMVLVLLRGDHALVEQKLKDGLGALSLRPAETEEIRGALGASPGSLGAVGVRDLRVAADLALRGRTNLVTGANQDDFHLRGVDLGRDVLVRDWLDLRAVRSGEGCPLCDAPLQVEKAIELGHCFKLGTRYAEALDVRFLDEAGAAKPIIMGSYGIGIGRTLAAIVERHHDANGIVWPVSVAPYEVVVSVLNPKETAAAEAGAGIYEALRAAGIDVVLDDRDERPGVKFKDADLVGIPYRVTVGPKGLREGKIELTRRRDGRTRNLDLQKSAEAVAETILEERR
jgi:prolyl-tRNA synthetase